MRVCVVSYIAPYTIPYIDIYLEQIRNMNVQCDIVFWDRDGNCEEKIEDGISYYPYSGKATQNDSKLKRYFGYLPATKHLRHFLNKNQYDRIIFLQTHAAVACNGILQRKYRKKYIVDIRDFTLEKFKLFRKIEERVIGSSYATVISSSGYTAFLPKHQYVIAHNYTPVNDATVQMIQNRCRSSDCINIFFIGYIRFYDMAKKLLLMFKNDERFHLNYIGTGADALAPFCEENNIDNVTLHDKFAPSQTAHFYANCDLINNLYGNHNPYLDYALSNKLYYAAQFHIPVLVSMDTYSSRVAEENHFGIAWNPDDEHAVDKLYEQFHTFDFQNMQKSSDIFLDKVIKDNRRFSQTIKEFLEA